MATLFSGILQLVIIIFRDTSLIKCIGTSGDNREHSSVANARVTLLKRSRLTMSRRCEREEDISAWTSGLNIRGFALVAGPTRSEGKRQGHGDGE